MTTSGLVIPTDIWITSSNGEKMADTTPIMTKQQPVESVAAEVLQQIALTELREDGFTKHQCLKQLKEWIQQNRDIEFCFTDDKFLLRFLRVKKFSLLMAQQVLLKYLNFRQRFRHIMFNMDCLDDKVNALFDNGYIFVSPYRDSKGRRVIIYNLNRFDPHQFSSTDMSRAHAIAYETLLDDEQNQIVGVNHVADLQGVTAAFVTLWSITEFATLIRWGEQSFPMRHKEVNLLNLPLALKYVYDFAQSNIKSQKLRDRFKIHTCLSDLHATLDKRCLPLEMDGSILSMAEMIASWKSEMLSKRKILLSYDSLHLTSDKGIIRRSNPNVTSSGGQEADDPCSENLPGSFRKLEVD